MRSISNGYYDHILLRIFKFKSDPASHEAEIMMEILKHGSHVEVLEPEWLREKVLNEMKVAVANYL
jgi:predicted DNA-binding transcriptional regulator YafY